MTPRNLILILSAGGFASTFSSRAVEPMVGIIARDLATSPQTIALLSAAFALPYAFIQPILGPVGDALGKERVIKVALALLLATLAGAMAAPDTTVLFALRIVSGAAAGGAVPLSLALIGDRVAMEDRQVALSRYLVAVIVGQLAGSSLAGLMAEAVGWRGVFGISAGDDRHGARGHGDRVSGSGARAAGSTSRARSSALPGNPVDAAGRRPFRLRVRRGQRPVRRLPLHRAAAGAQGGRARASPDCSSAASPSAGWSIRRSSGGC